MFFQTVKQVKIIIYIKTGILMIKGTTYKQFIDEEFEKIKRCLKYDATIPIFDSKEKTEVIIENDNETESAFQSIWSDIDKNRNAIRTLDTNILTLYRIKSQ